MGRTVAKTIEYDLPVVTSFAPDIVLLQLGTNDLSRLDPLAAIEELVTILHDTYKLSFFVYAKPFWDPILYLTHASALYRYVKTFLETLPYSFFWGNQDFWKSCQRFFVRDGGHLNIQGQSGVSERPF